MNECSESTPLSDSTSNVQPSAAASSAWASIRCLSIVRLSPTRPTFAIEPASGAKGYLHTQQHRKLEGYENWLDTSPLELQASGKIKNALLPLLEQVSPPPD